MGAPLGNQNAAKAKRWTAAIERALARKGSDAQAELDRLAEEFIEAVRAGNSAAIPGWRELGDRLEGKPQQAVELTGAEGGPVETSLRVTFGNN